MLAPPPAAWQPWTLSLPDGRVYVVDQEEIRGPSGAASVAAVQALVVAAYPTGVRLSDLRPGLALFQGSLLTLMLAPFLLWVVAVLSVVTFLTHFGSAGPPVP